MKKYLKIIIPVAISFAALSLHFLPGNDNASDPGFIFDMREVLGQTLTDENMSKYSLLLGDFVDKSKGEYFPDLDAELRVYNFKNGRIETYNGMIYGVWYLFKSSFAKFNNFKPTRPPVPGKDIVLKSFGFPTKNKNFASNNRAYIWEDEFNIRQLQLYREPADSDRIVSIQAYLIIPWEGLGNFHRNAPKKNKRQKEKGQIKMIL